MKNILIIIGIIIVIGAGYFFFLKEKAPVTNPEDTTSENEEVTEGEENTDPNPETEKPASYSYTNNEFKFAVTLPGLVVTAKGSSDPIYKPYIFTFGAGDQSNVPEEKRVPNTMAVYVWKNKVEFQILVSQMAPIGKETIHGHEFEIYQITEGERTSYRYTTTVGGTLYDVGVWNRADAKKFYLLD